jgi:hypothetical protein
MGYKTYEKLYKSCVMPIMEYGSEIWGYKEFQSLNVVQNRAMKFYSGVNKYTPTAGVYSELGWITPKLRQWKRLLSMWNRICNMTDDRLTKRVLKYSLRYNC